MSPRSLPEQSAQLTPAPLHRNPSRPQRDTEMPIRSENRHRYPSDWRDISASVRAEAGNRCEWCLAPNGVMIRRGHLNGRPVWQEAASVYCDVFCADTGQLLGGENADTCDFRSPPVRVVLTVAHLDHRPENCDRANLRALCQRCHNRYDAQMRRAGTKARSRSKSAWRDLFS
ncbi:MAG: hypothetical protein ACK4TJ_00775 [Tabrizicola sp.]